MITAPRDGTEILLYVDWEPLVVVGFWGNGDVNEEPPLLDDGGPAWRIKWDGSRLEHGFSNPSHWAPIPKLPAKINKMKSAPRDGEKIDIWMEIPASPRSMGMGDEFWVTDCWWQTPSWVHAHHGKNEPLHPDYLGGWLPAGSKKPEEDSVHPATP